VRLFFALWPSEPARSALAKLALEVAARSGGRAVGAEKLHLTLAFLGDTPRERIPAAVEAARCIDARCFLAIVDRVGSFARAGVAWAGMSAPPPALAELAARLSSRLREAQFVLDKRPFAAHATLARRIGRSIPAEPIDPIEWDATRFALVESNLRTGRYETLASWELEAR